MNLFIRSKIIALMLNVLAMLLLTISGVSAALPPAANYLGRIKGVVAPVRLAMDSLGKLYVADPRNSGIMQYDGAGHLIKKFPVKGARGIAITPSGDLVVTQGNTALVISTETGSTRFPLGQFKQASGVAVDDAGQIYVVDTLDSVVQVFSASGQPLTVKNSVVGKPTNSFGADSSSVGQLFLPTSIAYDKVSKQLIVSDTGNSRLAFFDMDGGFIRFVGGRAQNGTAPVFTSPQSVTLEYSKTTPQKLQRIYVSDSFQSEVQIIDPQNTGEYLGSIGGYGSTPGKLKVPVDTLFDPATSRLLITNGAGDITIYGINITSSPVPDTKPPTLTLDPLPGVSFTNAVVIGGTVEREALLQITASAGVIVGTINFSPSPDASLYFWQSAVSGLNQGANAITVIARDAASNSTTKTATITYDPTSVHVSINPFTRPVNNSVQTLSGTADQGATVTLSGLSGVTFDAVTISGTTWQSRVSGLTEGVNTITATASANGGKSSSVTTRINLLTSKPALEISALPDGSKTSQTILNVSGVLPLGSYFDLLTVNGVAAKVMNNAFSTAIQLNPGANLITVTARDTAGNTSEINRTIILDELLPTVTITEPSDGSYINGTDVNLKGSVKPGNTVRLLLYNGSANGVPFTQISQAADSSNGLWSTAGAIPLDPGLNTIIAEVTDKSGNSSKSKITITRDATIPALGVTSPIRDISVNKSSQTVIGTVATGTNISVTLNEIDVPLTQDAGGTYSIPVILSEEKQYALAITATDALGNSVTGFRNLVYDVTAPQITAVDPANPLKVTFKEGIPEVLDKNGPVTGVTITVNQDGSKTVDVSKATNYDLKTLDIHAVDAAGNSTRNGNVTGSGKVDIKDALKLLKLALSLDATTPEQMLRGDVAPVVNGVSKPDGVLDVFDVIYVLEKSVGLR
jgi:Glucodextranase, domain B